MVIVLSVRWKMKVRRRGNSTEKINHNLMRYCMTLGAQQSESKLESKAVKVLKDFLISACSFLDFQEKTRSFQDKMVIIQFRSQNKRATGFSKIEVM
jgi:hypothetical protein